MPFRTGPSENDRRYPSSETALAVQIPCNPSFLQSTSTLPSLTYITAFIYNFSNLKNATFFGLID
jgi:hypothetical protein